MKPFFFFFFFYIFFFSVFKKILKDFFFFFLFFLWRVKFPNPEVEKARIEQDLSVLYMVFYMLQLSNVCSGFFWFYLVLSHQNLLRNLVIVLECIMFIECFPFLLEMHTLTGNFSTLLYTAFSASGRFFRGWKLFSNASLCAWLLFEWVFGLLSLFLQYLMS